MQEYLSQVRRIQTIFESFDLSHIPRSGNTHADSLATLATCSTQNLPQVIIVEDLCTPTPTKKELLQIHQIHLGSSWMDPILLFLERDILPKEKVEAEKIRRNLRKPHRGKIPISPDHHSRILVARHAKRSARICQKM